MEERLKTIIGSNNKSPTIVNETSNFVVATYWWGRGNWNNNTARPCISFFEEFTNTIIKFAIVTFNKVNKINQKNIKLPNLDEIMDNNNFINHISLLQGFDERIELFTKVYFDMIFEKTGVNTNENKQNPNLRFEMAIQKIEEMKTNGITSNSYHLMKKKEIKNIFKEIGLTIIELNKDNILDLFVLNKYANMLKSIFLEDKEDITKEQVLDLNKKKKEFDNKIKATLKIKKNYKLIGEDFINMNIYDILNSKLRYIEPIKFETMIDNWEKTCREKGCNYLSIEYPEFAQPGGYQLAINAKPIFIKKALELCKPNRGVLYIDGDMFIRKYPSIFDLKNVDFMARGWWMDPRSSYRYQESIIFDPYSFETSGGTMFFSQSIEAKRLLDYWTQESSNPKQQGKADDRILSLIFNSKKFLLNMNIIQLPIEYLWLTLNYNDYLLESLYDWDLSELDKNIFIEHPECLTSEETASGSGASNDRTPFFYGFLGEENSDPVSEEGFEYLIFPNKEMTSSFQKYHEYMKETQYIDDGNEILIKKGFINKNNPEDNKYPLYITSFDEKYGKRNPIFENNNRLINSYDNNISLNTLKENAEGFIELNESYIPKPQRLKKGEELVDSTISIIISLLKKNKNVMYIPKDTNAGSYADILLYKSTNLQLIFYPMINEMSHILKPVMNLNKPILFRPIDENGKEMLIKILSMFKSLNDLNEYLKYGSYQIVSRIRIGYVLNKKEKSTKTKLGGNGTINKNDLDDYEDGLKYMYGGISVGRKIIKTRKNSKKTRNTRKIA